MQNKKKEPYKGWLEVLWRKKTSPASFIRGPKSIDFSDYVMHGSSMPISEFESVIDVYEFYARPQPGVPRVLEEYDLVNMVFTYPTRWVKTLVLLDPYKEKSKLFRFEGVDRLGHWVPDRMPMCMVPLQRPLGSYCERTL